MCSSTRAVQEYLEQSSYHLFKTVTGLGGALLITASEYHPVYSDQSSDGAIVRSD
jgi:hypothetical protein